MKFMSISIGPSLREHPGWARAGWGYSFNSTFARKCITQSNQFLGHLLTFAPIYKSAIERLNNYTMIPDPLHLPYLSTPPSFLIFLKGRNKVNGRCQKHPEGGGAHIATTLGDTCILPHFFLPLSILPPFFPSLKYIPPFFPSSKYTPPIFLLLKVGATIHIFISSTLAPQLSPYVCDLPPFQRL